MMEILANSVKYDDRVMDRKSDDREHGRYEEGVDFPVEEVAQDREGSEQDEDVVQQGDDGARAELQAFQEIGNRESERQVQDDKPARIHDGKNGVFDELVADYAADHLDLFDRCALISNELIKNA